MVSYNNNFFPKLSDKTSIYPIFPQLLAFIQSLSLFLDILNFFEIESLLLILEHVIWLNILIKNRPVY